MSLGSANQLLVDKKIITLIEKNNKSLKKILEKGNLPHAYQTEDSPKQWRIPLSEEGKIRKKKTKRKKTTSPKIPNHTTFQNQVFNNTICPGCFINLSIPTEIINEDYIQCLTCGKTFQNPLKTSNEKNHNHVNIKDNDNNLQKVIGGFILLIVCIIFPPLIIIVVPMAIYYLSKNSNEKQKINALLEQQLMGKTPQEIENIRNIYIEMTLNPYSTEVEKANAKYIVRYIEQIIYKY